MSDQFEDFENAVDNKTAAKVEETEAEKQAREAKEAESQTEEVEDGEEQESQEEQEGDTGTEESLDYKKLYEEEQARSRKAAEKLLKLDPFALDEETPEEKATREAAEAAAQKTTPEAKKSEAETKVEVKVDIPVELTDEQIEEMFEQPAKFREFIKGRDSQIASSMAPAIKEAILKDVVGIQGRLTENVVKAQVAIDTFFAQNPDLGKPGTRQTVEDMAAGIKAKRPGLSADECLKEAGSRIRTHLRIAAPADKGFAKPAGTGTTTTRQVVRAPSKLEAEIESFEKAGRG